MRRRLGLPLHGSRWLQAVSMFACLLFVLEIFHLSLLDKAMSVQSRQDVLDAEGRIPGTVKVVVAFSLFSIYI